MRYENETEMRRTIALFLLTCLCAAGVAQRQPEGTFRVQSLFAAGQAGYFNFRIPSLVTSPDGVLLAFCSARKGKGFDHDPIDIALRRSTDAGRTWDSMRVIVHRPDGASCDNATPIADYRTGQVHLVYQIDYERIYCTSTSDNGLTWSAPVDITATLEGFRSAYDWLVAAPGPGHGIQLRSGRLVVPCWLSTGGRKEFGRSKIGHRPSIVVSIYSDDHGRTWLPGEVAVPDNDTIVIPNETSCLELADGRVMFNSRNESVNYRRVVTCSPDGASRWERPRFEDAFFEPVCYGSMCRYTMRPFQSRNRILFCNPDSRYDPWVAPRRITPRSAPGRRRANLTVRMSYDEGVTWPVSKVIDPGIAGYSDLAVTPDGMIHCLYEGGALEGDGKRNRQMNFVTFDLRWLTGGQDALKRREIPLKPSVK